MGEGETPGPGADQFQKPPHFSLRHGCLIVGQQPADRPLQNKRKQTARFYGRLFQLLPQHVCCLLQQGGDGRIPMGE
jgi:hypothetical protein